MLLSQKYPQTSINYSNRAQIDYYQLPISNFNNQHKYMNNSANKINNIKKQNINSTKETSPRKEYSKVLKNSTIKNALYNPTKEKNKMNELDDSLSQISVLLNSNKKHLNFSDLVGKIPGIEDEPNFVYDQMLYNKSRIKKVKILQNKIGTLKLPVSNISFKEALNISDRGKKCFSDRPQINQSLNRNRNKSDEVDITCCIFRKKS